MNLRISPKPAARWLFRARRVPVAEAVRAYFSAFAGVLVAVALLAGCAQLPVRGAAGASAAQPLARLQLPASGSHGEVAALLIAAEFALAKNDVAQAASDYAQAAGLSSDPHVAERAVELALANGDAGEARTLMNRWRALGASAHDLAAPRAQLAMLGGDEATAVKQFRILLAHGEVADWKTFAANLLAAPDSAMAGRILKQLAVPDRIPHDEHVWVALSQLAQHLGQPAYARKLAAGAVRRFDDAGAIRWAASLAVESNDRAGALRLYAKGVAAHPRNVDLRLDYATALAAGGDATRALQVLADGPQTPATWSARVAIAAQAGDDAALRRLYADLQRAPGSAHADNAFLLGQLAELLHHDRAALAWYGKVEPDSRHGFEAGVRRAVLLEHAGEFTQAHALATQLQRDYVNDPGSLRTAYELEAQLYSDRGEHAKAIDAYDRGLAALPNDPELTYDRGIAEADAGDTDAALADFRRVLAENPSNVDAMNALGFTLADADRDLPEATRLLEKALAAKPDAAAIMDSWGWLQYRLGHLTEAETWLERAWKRQRDPDIGVHLGEVLWKLGDRTRARDVFATVRKLDPHNRALAKAEERLRP